jgi:hypothetical protein
MQKQDTEFTPFFLLMKCGCYKSKGINLTRKKNKDFNTGFDLAFIQHLSVTLPSLRHYYSYTLPCFVCFVLYIKL